MSANYPSNLTFRQFKVIEPLIPPAKQGGRPRTVDMLAIINGIMYKVKTGCQWEMLPKDFPPCKTVYHYFREWTLDGTWQRLHDEVVKLVRKKGKEETPSVGIIDSQSIKTANQGNQKGYDAGKNVNGRKRHILVDTIGLIHSLIVHEGNIQDRDGTKLVLFKVKGKMPRLVKIFADAGYAGKLIDYVLLWFGWVLEIVKRTDKGFKVLPFRWIVERTFAWFNNYRGLSKDYEYSTKSSEGLIYIAMLHLMLRRLAK